MTQERDFRDFLKDIVEACRAILRFVEGISLDAYLADEKTRYAVMRGFEIMGEAVRNLPAEVKDRNPHIPWAMMMAVRNRIAHGYFGIDDSILFATIEEDLKPMLPELETLAEKYFG